MACVESVNGDLLWSKGLTLTGHLLDMAREAKEINFAGAIYEIHKVAVEVQRNLAQALDVEDPATCEEYLHRAGSVTHDLDEPLSYLREEGAVSGEKVDEACLMAGELRECIFLALVEEQELRKTA